MSSRLIYSKKNIGLVLILILQIKAFAQVDSLTKQYIHTLNARHSLTLLDEDNGSKYILDSTRTQITALSRDGRMLWQTRPIVENNQKDIVDHPQFILTFEFMKDDKEPNKENIHIRTNSKFEGFIDKKNGKYTFLGRD